jgi:hypothetical protein
LTAVVLLPTPPLPDATATMFLTFGSSCTPRWTACGVTLVARFALTFATSGQRARRRDQRLAERRNLALRRVAELDVEGDVAASMRTFLTCRVETKSLPVFGSMTLFSASSSAVSVTGMGALDGSLGGGESSAARGAAMACAPRIEGYFRSTESPSA